ncbi:MAG: hypothetical protein IIZ36_03260 [Ruminococcus sp.]|nr:hypothetical protein [Ruminococcus sp.]
MNVFSARRAVPVLRACALALLCVILVIFSEEGAKGAGKGIEMCLNVLIPSLFPFTAASRLIVKCGAAESAGKLLKRPMSRLFGLNGSFAPVILLSMIGGYPVGAGGISELRKCGADEAQCRKAAMFCVCAGPGFLINFIGASVYGSEELGIILFVSQLLSVIIIGAAVNIFDGRRYNNSNSEIKREKLPFGTALTEAVADSSRAMLSICAFVVIFSSVTAIIRGLISEEALDCAAAVLLEVCSAVDFLSDGMTIEAVAFAVGFGGLCVHFQIFSALESVRISKLLFFVIRIIQGAITALLTHLGLIAFPQARPVFSSVQTALPASFGRNAVSGLALIMTAVFFLFSIKSLKRR